MEIVVGPQFSGPTSTTSAKRLKDAGTSSRTPSWWQISIANFALMIGLTVIFGKQR